MWVFASYIHIQSMTPVAWTDKVFFQILAPKLLTLSQPRGNKNATSGQLVWVKSSDGSNGSCGIIGIPVVLNFDNANES